MEMRLIRWMGLSAKALALTAQRFGIAFAGMGLFSGCMGDPPPEPEVQPLEIIVGNPDPTYGPCVLNVDEVGAGTHGVTSVAMAGSARVRIVDPSGAVVYERAIQEEPAMIESEDVMQEDQQTVDLQAGDHRVECILADGTHSASLMVVPASRQ